MRKRVKNFLYFILGTLICSNILAWFVLFDLSRPQALEVTFFDVGQGDAIFIETPERHQILIDGGPSSKILEKLGKEMPFYDRSIDLIILTHPDPDHLNGLVDVLKSYKVGLVGFNGAKGTNPAFSEFEKQIIERKIPVVILYNGKKIKIGSIPAEGGTTSIEPGSRTIGHPEQSSGVGEELFFDILSPSVSFEGKKVSDFNTSSIVAKLVYGQNEFIFTGDAPKSIEKTLVESNLDLDSDILKVGHHGSKTSTTDVFLDKVSPDIAVISVGKDNQYGHPHLEVLERLEKYGIKILRTDQNGDIKIFSDGRNYTIK
jgi:competence protein ComEC